jgi:LysM repeat protein
MDRSVFCSTRRGVLYVALIAGLAACGAKEHPARPALQSAPPPAAQPAPQMPTQNAPPEPAPLPAPQPQPQTEPQPQQSAPPAAQTQPEPQPQADAAQSDTYTVAKGDTLYHIAREHSLNYRDLQRWNHLSDPGQIRVGQKLRLTAPDQ